MKTFFLIFLSFVLFSCEKEEIRSKKGGIDIISNFYFNASKNLDDVKNIYISKINYEDDKIIELVPNIDFPEFIDKTFFIKDTLFYEIEEENQFIFSLLKNKHSKSIFEKEKGAVFSKSTLPFFEKRKNLTDTTLLNKKYKRFEINNKENYAVFYVYETDTILPYSIYKEEAKKYKGRIERIDSYNKEKDIFISLQLISRNYWDDKAKNIFEFNEFVEKRNNTK